MSATGLRGDRRRTSTINPVAVTMITPAAKMPNHLRSACSAAMRARCNDFNVKSEFVGLDTGDKVLTDILLRTCPDLPDDRALPGHDARISAERTAPCRHLRQE